jgi:hypothetical protein
MRHRFFSMVVALTGGILASGSWSGTAEAREVEASFGVAAHRMGSPSVDALSSSDILRMGDLGVAIRIGPEFPILGPIYAEAQVSFGTTDASDFNQIDTELAVTALQVGVHSSRPIRRWLRGFARGDIGLIWGDVTLRGVGSRTALRDTDRSMSAYAGLGLEATFFQTRPQRRNDMISLGLRVELGYLAARSLSFSADPAYPDDDLNRIETVSAPLGSTDLSGPSLRVQLVGRF